jgi:hypothetical protein
LNNAKGKLIKMDTIKSTKHIERSGDGIETPALKHKGSTAKIKRSY